MYVCTMEAVQHVDKMSRNSRFLLTNYRHQSDASNLTSLSFPSLSMQRQHHRLQKHVIQASKRNKAVDSAIGTSLQTYRQSETATIPKPPLTAPSATIVTH